MNKPIARALLLDAYYQVLDNKIFRILALLVCPMVLFAFVVGFRPEGIVLLWGVKTITYQEFAGWFGQHISPGTQDVNLSFIQGAQHMVVGQLAGDLGILLSLAATAFFVPRMLEKGAADIIFSRPVGRTTLLLARYMAGVLFVAMLGTVLIVGMHLGFLIVSGSSDPAFLWSILTLTYVFALVHSVSTVVAVLSRSSVAAVLTALIFFSFNGCVHSTAWIPLEWTRARNALEKAESTGAEAGSTLNLDDGAAGIFTRALDVLHFTLPKTTDADIIVAKLRTLVSGEKVILRDGPGALVLYASAAPYEFVERGTEVDLAREPAGWTWKGEAGTSCTLALRRESRLVDKAGDKPRRRSSAEYARDFMASLKGEPGGQPTERSRLQELRIDLECVSWGEAREMKKFVHGRAWFASGDWMYVLELEGESPAAPGTFTRDRFRELSENFRIDRDDARYMEPQAWYTRTLDWNAPLRHNIFFSIGSSLLFALLLLALAAWKLRRIDF